MSVYTDILTNAGLGTNAGHLLATVYDKYVEFALRSYPWYRSIADKRPVNPTSPGTSIVFNFYADLATATGALTETTDPNFVQIPATTTVTCTLNEYGNSAVVTRKLRLATLSDIDPAIADIIAFNMVQSLDEVVRGVLVGGTYVIYENSDALKVYGAAGAARLNVLATDELKSRDVRAATTHLRKLSAIPRFGNAFAGFMHPDVSYDLRSETSNGDWRAPHQYTAAGNIWAGVIGEYEGVLWTETPRAYYTNDGNAGAFVHRTLVVGKQALAEAVADEPHVVLGPITDRLMRFRPIGWYGMLGWARYREESIVRIETSSTVTVA